MNHFFICYPYCKTEADLDMKISKYLIFRDLEMNLLRLKYSQRSRNFKNLPIFTFVSKQWDFFFEEEEEEEERRG